MTKQLQEILHMNEDNTDTFRDTSVARPLCSLIRLIHIEHNYNCIPPDSQPAIKSKRTLRQLVCSLQAEKNLGPLDFAALKEHILRADVILRRLRRFLASKRRFIDFSPMSVLQEAIVQHLAAEMRCTTRFYDGQGGRRYLVAYRPGIGPNSFELRAREGDLSGDCKQTRMCLRKTKLKCHKLDLRQITEHSCRLGRKILEKLSAKKGTLRRNEET
ncbi:uncharacterized protein LOC122613941 [Drosophila teissieri]|uniref:uncharacterized protein LOC122613941 n=1 Tax=Drosophila teissieri TaxID=7243 RepID=UPI001CBA3830|nr:uncharacterized protein LOC122613941 [Drosophila teissieri]